MANIWYSYIKNAGLLGLGFFVGALGLSLSESETPSIVTSVLQHDKVALTGTAFGAMCAVDENREEDEIFFLSCGGIF